MSLSRGHRAATLVTVLLCSLLLGCTEPEPGPDDEPGSGGGGLFDVQEPEATVCDGKVGAEEVEGDLLVPRRKTCRLEGTAVAGRVTVSPYASLVAVDARFGEGIGAHAFDRVELLRGRAEGRSRHWSYGNGPEASKITDFVFDGGRTVVLRNGPSNGRYYVLGTRRTVEITGLYLDLGGVYCAGNAREPVVRGISAESPGVLQGQCAGLRNFGDSDF